nr:hypothetical protein CFP56_49550 [Quercus suber]
MEAETGPQPDDVQQQQIQALLANVEELTCQNEELRKTMESQNIECQRIGEDQNEGESNSQANRQDRTLGEDSAKMENELYNMRKEVDKLKERLMSIAPVENGRNASNEMVIMPGSSAVKDGRDIFTVPRLRDDAGKDEC